MIVKIVITILAILGGVVFLSDGFLRGKGWHPIDATQFQLKLLMIWVCLVGVASIGLDLGGF